MACRGALPRGQVPNAPEEPGKARRRDSALELGPQKRAPPGQSRHKKKACLGSALPVLGESQKFEFLQNRPPRVERRRRFCESTSWEKEERSTNLAHLNPPHIFSLRSNKRGPGVWGRVSQKRATGGSGPQRSERKAAPAGSQQKKAALARSGRNPPTEWRKAGLKGKGVQKSPGPGSMI